MHIIFICILVYAKLHLIFTYSNIYVQVKHSHAHTQIDLYAKMYLEESQIQPSIVSRVKMGIKAILTFSHYY